MKFDTLSRRLVLQGAGASLVLPVLASLMPRGALADVVANAAPIRYVQVMSPYGPSQALFYGALKGVTRVSPHVSVTSLSDYGANISPMITDAFGSLRPKFSILRGLDVFVVTANHQFSFATTASGYAKGLDNDEAPPVTGQSSIDTILASSPKVYSADVPAERRQLNLNPLTTDSYSSNRTWSWRNNGTKVQMIRPVKQTQALFDALSVGFVKKQVDPNETALLQAVSADYKAVRNGPRISVEDRNKLDAYVALVSDIEKGLTASVPVCTTPIRAEEVDVEATIDNQFGILAAAMACDLTRVAGITLGMSEGYGTRHTEHHGILGNPPGIVTDYKLIGARVARLLKIFDNTKEAAGGTLLDNSIVYWSTQYGLATLGGQHSASDMPVMIAGGARGNLKQGRYLDYRHEIGGTVTEFTRQGIALSNLLVTLFNCMGLSSADYESVAGQGYGYVDPTSAVWANRPNPTQWDTEAGRRSPVPLLYSGPTRG